MRRARSAPDPPFGQKHPKEKSFWIGQADTNLTVANVKTGAVRFSTVIDTAYRDELSFSDITNDGRAEIFVGNTIFTNDGAFLYDKRTDSPAMPMDFDRDGRPDVIAKADSFVTIRSGKNNELLFVHPFASWTGGQDAVTTGVLARIDEGSYRCYDYNISFPRYSVAGPDSVNLTIRVANVGAAPLSAGLAADFYADTAITASSQPNLSQLIHLKQLTTSATLASGGHQDMVITTLLPSEAERLWFVVDGEQRYFNPIGHDYDNHIKLELGL